MEESENIRRVRAHASRLQLPCGEFVQADGEWTHYRYIDGTGSPVLLLHGLMAWSFTWEAMLAHLADRPAWAPDLRGFGWSDKNPRREHDLTSQARRLLRLMDLWKIEQATLVGHSMGGEISLRLALMAPERIRSLVLMDSACYVSGRDARVERLLRLPAWLARLLLRKTVLTPRYARQTLHAGFHDPTRVTAQAITAYAAPAGLPGAAATLHRMMGQLDFGAWQERYAEIRQPACLIWGEHDTWTPLAHGRRLAGVLQDAQLHVVAQAHHIPHEERPEEVGPLLRGWLQQAGH